MKDEKEILALIEQYEQNSYGQYDQALVTEREDALDRFYGRPYGDEVEGRSQVVSQDTRDTILWVMPQLMKIFAAGDTVCKFNPRNAEDVVPAEQETEYLNYLIMEKNRGFEVFYNWFFDALLSKTGYVKIYWEDVEDSERETYKGISQEEAAAILQNPSLEIVAQDSGIDEYGQPWYTIVVESRYVNGCLTLKNIAPENVMVDYGVSGTNLQNADFVEEICIASIGDLQAQGYDVTDEDAGNTELAFGVEELARDNYSEFQNRDWNDGKSRKVTLREVYLRMEDDDGDLGLFRILVAGRRIIDVTEAEYVPYAALCPIPMPHRHVGLSYADVTMDLERIKTQLLRNALDSQYLAIHGRWAADTRVVDLDSLLVSRPGGVVQTSGPPGQAIMPLVNPQDGSSALNTLEYVDSILQQRTGVSDKTQGIAEDAIQETATATAKLMSAAQERIYMIARIFAETGVKDLFLLAHQIVRKHANKQDIIQLRNQWVPIDPRTWKTRKDMTVTVGLGTGDKEEMRINLMTILQAQQQAIMVGIATPKNIYNALAKLTQNAGFKNVEDFWTDPATNPMPEKPDPEMVKLQGQMQIEQMKAQVQSQQRQQELAMEERVRQREIEMEAQKQAQQAQNDMMEREHQAQLQSQMEAQRLEFERWKAQLEAETKVLIAEIAANSKAQVAQAGIEAKAQADAANSFSGDIQ